MRPPSRPGKSLLLPLLFLLLATAARLLAAPEAKPAEPGERMDLEEAAKRKLILFAPRPTYPYEAGRRHESGAGIAQVDIDEDTGRVQSVVMSPSTGSAFLDKATIDVLGRWKVEPHTVAKIRVPISYTERGVSFSLLKEEKSLVEMLAPSLGPGTLRKAPAPTYPEPQSWSHKHGKGVYELHADSSGRVIEVKILQSSGDQIFDKTVRKTLSKWELARGPLVVEIPLSFILTPNSYRVDVAR